MTAMLEHENDLKDFAKAYKLKIITQAVEGDSISWQYSVEHGRATHTVRLAGSLLQTSLMLSPVQFVQLHDVSGLQDRVQLMAGVGIKTQKGRAFEKR